MKIFHVLVKNLLFNKPYILYRNGKKLKNVSDTSVFALDPWLHKKVFIKVYLHLPGPRKLLSFAILQGFRSSQVDFRKSELKCLQL